MMMKIMSMMKKVNRWIMAVLDDVHDDNNDDDCDDGDCHEKKELREVHRDEKTSPSC